MVPWTTLGLILWPFGLMILAFMQPEESNDIFFGSRAASAITPTAVVTLYSLVKTFTNSIAENGPVIGSIVGKLKFYLQLLFFCACLSITTEENRSTLIFITIFTFIFKWILDVLVNVICLLRPINS